MRKLVSQYIFLFDEIEFGRTIVYNRYSSSICTPELYILNNLTHVEQTCKEHIIIIDRFRKSFGKVDLTLLVYNKYTIMSDVSPRLPDIAEFSFREGLIVVVSVCGLLSLFVFLRLICNVSLDICILCDVEQARRSFSAWNDFWCPCFRRQRMVNPQPEEGQVQQQAQSQVGAIPPPDLNSLLSGLSKEERVQILGSLLPFKVCSTYRTRLCTLS